LINPSPPYFKQNIQASGSRSQNSKLQEWVVELLPPGRSLLSMATSTSTEVFILQETRPEYQIAESPARTTTQYSSSFDPAADAIIAESRLADAQVPDGGYGWIVTGACSVLTFWFVGTSYSWGVIQAALVEQKLSTPASLSFVGSLTAACISFFALINARIVRWIGGRNTALAGVMFLGMGEILSGFSTKNVGGLFFTAGLLMGIGCSLQFMVCGMQT
jgi:hypothetical protein